MALRIGPLLLIEFIQLAESLSHAVVFRRQQLDGLVGVLQSDPWVVTRFGSRGYLLITLASRRESPTGL
jgi:hypothetical protein